MMQLKEIIAKFKSAEKDRTFPYSEWHRKDVFEKLVRPFLIVVGYNPDQINYDDTRGIVELLIRNESKAIIYVSSIQEEQRFLSNKISAPIDTIPDPEINKPKYEIAIVTNFEKWFFYFDGKEIHAISGDRLEEEFNIIKNLVSKDAIESGKFKEVARIILYKEDNEPLRQELNSLRLKIAQKILQERTNIPYLKNADGSYNNELLNEITTRWITRFLSLKLAEDSGISFNFTLRDIRRSFELSGKVAKPISGAKVKEETLSNAVRALMNEFERRFNGGIFMYEEGVDYITIPDTAFFDLLDFSTGWAFTTEDARIIGFVYERFLGQEIVIEERKGKIEAALKNIGEARGKRKAGGIYYTPKYIVDYIVENTLGTILKEKGNEIDNAVKNLEIDKFTRILKEVKSLRVLDPACGSGSFLIKVLAEFKNFYDEVKGKANELKQRIDKLKREKTKGQLLFTNDKEVNELLTKYSNLEKELQEIEFPGSFALRHNIYGVDLDPKAISITAFTLMVQVYDELKDGARCPTMINENLKVGNSLVSAITPEERDGFISRKELERFRDEINNLIKLREVEKSIDGLDNDGLRKLIRENFEDVIEIYLHIKQRYPNAIPTSQQKLLDEWHKKAKKELIEKTFDVLINQTGLARVFVKEVYFEKIKRIKEKIEEEINKPLIKYFNSEKRVFKDKELKEILSNPERTKEELRFVRDKASEISKSQPPKAFNWEIEFPEVFFEEGNFLQNMKWLISEVKKENYKDISCIKEAVIVGKINKDLKEALQAKEDLVYLKLEIYAKIRSWWEKWRGHPEIDLKYYLLLPLIIYLPDIVLKDRKRKNVYLFAKKINHYLLLAIEINRNEERNEINTIFIIKEKKIRKYEIIWELKEDRLGRTVTPPDLPSEVIGVAGDSNISGLQAVQMYYNNLIEKCQEEISQILKYLSLKENPGFDCVVGNPPHGAELVEVIRHFTEIKFFKTSSTYKNTASMFIELSTSLVKLNGLNGLIVPKSLTFVDAWRDTREFLINTGLLEIGDISKAFEAVKLEQVFICWTKHTTDSYTASYFDNEKRVSIGEFKIDVAKEIDCLIVYPSEKEIEMRKKIKNHCVRMKDISRTFRGLGIQSRKVKRKTTYPILRGDDIERYRVKEPIFYIDEKYLFNKFEHNGKIKELLKPKLLSQNIVAHIEKPADRIIIMSAYDDKGILTFDTVENTIVTESKFDEKYILGCLNSSFVSWYSYLFIYNKAIRTMHFDSYYIGKIPIPNANQNQQAPVISLVDAIIQKKKEYLAISQNIEDYIRFEDCKIIRLEDFIINTLEDFDILPPLKVKTDNFDALRIRIEGEYSVVEYGIRRKIEEYEVDEEGQEEIKSRYSVEWHEAAMGKIKEIEAIEFLSRALEREKRISKAKEKLIWQKIAEITVPEFNEKVKDGFLKFKSAMQKAKEFDEEILKIDRAIDRLVYDLYGLTEEEIQVVEKSVWGDKFEVMYSKLSSKENALMLSKVYEGKK